MDSKEKVQPSNPDWVVDPFGGVKPRLLGQGREGPLRVNPEQAQAFGSASSPSIKPYRAKSRDRPGSRWVDKGLVEIAKRNLEVLNH